MGRILPREFHTRDDTPFLVRSVEFADAEILLAFVVTTAATTDQILTRPEEFPDLEGEREFILSMLERDSNLLIGAMHQGRFIASLGFHGSHNLRRRHVGEIGMMVAAEWRGRGVGEVLLVTALDWTRAHPFIEKVCLSVYDENRIARGLYRKLGFEEEGRQPGQIRLDSGRYVDLIHMGLWVKPRP